MVRCFALRRCSWIGEGHWFGFAARIKTGVRLRNTSGFESMMTHVADPRNAPEMLLLRESMRAWRFYDQFRTDVDAPAIAADRDVYSYPGKRWS